MENFDKLKWFHNTTPIATEEKLSFYYSFSDCDLNTKKDILYCHLHEIDQKLLNDAKYVENLNDTVECDEVTDPRNRKVIQNLTNDFSEKFRFKRRSSFFTTFPCASTLTRQEHISCLRFLKAKVESVEPNITDTKVFEETEDKREKEYKIYSDFVKNYVLANPITFFKDFEILYRNVLNYFSEKIDTTDDFSVQAGLPIFDNIVPKQEIIWQCCPTLSYINGYFPKSKQYFDMYKIKIDVVNYLNNLEEFVSYPSKSYSPKSDVDYDVRISEQAIALIMGISSETDYESEIPLEIKDNKIEIKQPLPSRYINENTNLFVFNILFRNFINKHHKNTFKKFENGSYVAISNNVELIDAVDLSQNYKLQPIEKYLNHDIVEDFKSSYIISKIVLNNSNPNPLNVLIDFENVGYLNEKNDIVNISFKLEYKKKFGLEQMTFKELLTECIRAYFIPNLSTIRYRIDTETFEVLHSSMVTKSELETELFELYNIKISTLLSKLYEFLRMVQNFPDGKYLLQYNPKFNDKFLVYGTNILENSKTISIKSLFKNSSLLIKNNFIPIDNVLCIGIIHDKLHIMPGCFPPWGKKRKCIARNDREKMIKKEQDKKENLKKIVNARKMKAKQRKRKRQREQKKQEIISEVSEKEENLDYSDLLIEKYANSTSSNPVDYFTLNQGNSKISETSEIINIDKYLSDAAGSSSCVNNFTQEEYLQTKKLKNSNFTDSLEIESRKASFKCKNYNFQSMFE